MRKYDLSRRRVSEKGEGNGKFIGVLVVFALIGYVLYSVMPVYYQEQQLNHDVKEIVRIAAVNGRDEASTRKQVEKTVQDINFKGDIDIKVVKKGDNITADCTGTIPISLIVYTYDYKVSVSQTANRGGY